MTVIAALAPANYAVLISDVLLSGSEVPDITANLPTIGPVTEVFPKGSGWTITSLRQKSVILAANCAVAWAGDYLAARMVVKDLRNLVSQDTLSYSDIETYFTDLDPEIASRGVSFVGWLRDERGIRSFGFDCLGLQSTLLGEVRLAGTGAQALADHFQHLPDFLPAASGVDPNPLERAVSVALFTAGAFLEREISTGTNLLEYYGGGYEIVSEVRGRFKKIDDVTYLFWKAEVRDDAVAIAIPSRVIKHSYSDDVLVLRSVAITGQEGKYAVDEENLFLISPLLRSLSVSEAASIAQPALKSRFYCHCIEVQFQDKRHVLVRVEYNGSGNSKNFTISDSDIGVSLTISEDFIRSITATIRHRFL